MSFFVEMQKNETKLASYIQYLQQEYKVQCIQFTKKIVGLEGKPNIHV